MLLHTDMRIAPKVFIVSMFSREQDIWADNPQFNIFAQEIAIPGLSPLFPHVHCTQDGSVCELVTGEGEINSAVTMTSLLFSKTAQSIFNLRKTYFLIAGVAGGNPKHVTLGSVTFARFAVQVTLQYEIDAREIPKEFPTGYMPQGVKPPDIFNVFPPTLYGTEVFEVNDNLRQVAYGLTKNATLHDNSIAQAYRANYGTDNRFIAGSSPPSVALCDTTTADTFWSGNLLAEAFENTTKLFTNGSAVYCSSQQEDNATLEALLRGAISGLVDFSRIIIMRTISNFDRPFPSQTAVDGRFAIQGGFASALANIQIAGSKVIQEIVDEWDDVFEEGIEPENYIGNVFGSLGRSASRPANTG
ncbi:purine nucleoside permease [Gymnopus androsaceus JB14]|uniref:Purine nucleoside permease n=1 Tax=Gymnopus androsaceus JB14 TaxID=1447944 RepID=A0A6A4HHT8_9AGAR|nr:purine nucleoside permease [Gymnopus androsaceus JB14]